MLYLSQDYVPVTTSHTQREPSEIFKLIKSQRKMKNIFQSKEALNVIQFNLDPRILGDIGT